jgi:predicted MFS family arabinose efflux permease
VLILFFVGEGPFRKPATHFEPSAIIRVFRSADFRAAAFGYFGHMWELYTFWAFVPAILLLHASTGHQMNISLWSFIIIGIGGISCVAGGYIAEKKGSGRVAFFALLCSGLCCLVSFSFFQLPLIAFLLIMLVWSICVIADSPQFSTLIAQTAIPEYKGTALTIVTCIGFAITIASVQLISYIFNHWTKPTEAFIFLAPGPFIGLLFLFRLVRKRK